MRAGNAAADALAEAGLAHLAGGRLVLADRAAQGLLARALESLRRGLPLPAACHAVLVAGGAGERRTAPVCCAC